MGFLTKFKKEVEKVQGIGTSSKPPRYWCSTGNLVLNKIISGDFYRGIPQGRITAFAGPSGVGKSFLVGNAIKNAQKDGYIILVMDSEHALDDEYMHKIGVDTSHEDYMYLSVSSINHVVKMLSDFIKGYMNEFTEDDDAPKVMVVVDSLDMLATDSELDNFNKGANKGDQGQKSKQLKALLKMSVNAIKHLNISMIVTTQVYQASAEQKMMGEGVWVVGNAIRFSLSQIVMLTKLKLKEEGVKPGQKNTAGIRMKCEGFKTRFTKPFQIVTIEVPYDTGMDESSGLLQAFQASGVVETRGSWNYVPESDIKFQKSGFSEHIPMLMKRARESFLNVVDSNYTDDEI